MPPVSTRICFGVYVPVQNPDSVQRFERSQAIVEHDQSRRRFERARRAHEVTQRHRLDPLVDDRRAPIVEGDDRQKVLVAEGGEHTHVVPDLTSKGGVSGQRRAEETNDHR